ncbi:MAG: cupin domain-containing protein [Candidatus Omnitrophota bacterium]|nr:cupin domain-containing protein [Candidatus Omnitrophota bacterium]
MIEKLIAIEEFDGCVAYDCGALLYINLKKGTTASNHSHNHEETIFLMTGEAEAIIGDKAYLVKAPIKAVIPANTFHKFTALTDLIGLELK